MAKRKKSSSKDNAEGCAGCLVVLLVLGVIGLVIEYIRPIMIVVAVIAAIAISVKLVQYLIAKSAEKKAQDAVEKEQRERAAYDAYFRAQNYSDAKYGLAEANAIIRKLFAEQDAAKRAKIIEFFDKYLPPMTDILEARKHGDVEMDDTVETFTETVKAFSKDLYEVDDVVDANSSVIESLAISDGLYEPYQQDFAFDIDVETESKPDDATEVAPNNDTEPEKPAEIKEDKEAKTRVEEQKKEVQVEDPEEEMIILEDYE